MKSKSRILALITILTLSFVMICAVACQHEHDPNSIYRHDEEYHWFVCNKCGEELDKEEHVFGSDKKCIFCGVDKPVEPDTVELVINDKDKYVWEEIETQYGEIFTYEYLSEESFYLQITGLAEDPITKKTVTPKILNIPDRIGAAPVSTIAANAFDGCESIVQVTVPEAITTIGDYAFQGCTNLRRIKLPKSASYGRGVFQFCSNLDFVDLGAIKSREVYNEYWEEFETIPPSIPEYMFSGCTKLHKIIISDSVTAIDFGAFADCISLEEMVIGSGVTEIRLGAFTKDTKLKRVYYNGTKAKWDKIKITADGNEAVVKATKAFYSKNTPTSAGTYWTYTPDNLISLWPKK